MKRLRARELSGLSRLVLVIGIIIGAIGLGAGGMALAHGGDSAKVHACVSKSSGLVRVVSADGKCVDGEYALDWNIQGPVGPAGPAGTFSGTFRSPNGQYSLSVTDAGIVLSGAGSTVRLDAAGVTVSGASVTVQGATTTRVNGGIVALNCASGGGQPVARVGDLITGTGSGFGSVAVTGSIAGGSTTVLAC
jgi:hypothetical protein